MWKPILVVAVLAGSAAGLWLLSRTFAPTPEAAGPNPGDVWFEDVAGASGLNFRHFDPHTPLHLIPETMGSGLGWIDYDGDGWPDLFCIQDGPVPPHTTPNPPTHKLYRNNRDGTFADVSDKVGLNVSGFGVGCAVGDYDNDGFDDLLVTYLGGISLFRNEPDPSAPGGRRFKDVTAAAKLHDMHWGTSAAWGDLDGDGFLDLYVCNYVEIDPAKPVTCLHPEKKLLYQCSPTAFPYSPHLLFRNNRDGTFADVSRESGVNGPDPAPGLAVAIVDLDGDGKPDIFVANDMNPAFLFKNLGGMKFQEVALRSGAALGPGGARISGMCAEVLDAHGAGRPDVFVTNFQNAPNVLFRNAGTMRFEDASYSSGLGGPGLTKLGFGACALDADLDGNTDLAVANGHVHRTAREIFGVPYAQDTQLFLNDGAGKFRDGTATAGATFARPRVGRGLARADYDNDGLPDLAQSGIGEPVALFRNRTATANNWVGLELVGDGKGGNRSAVGAVVRVEFGGKARTHFVPGGGSYLSASDRRLSVGMGSAAKADRVVVRWPNGKEQEYRDLPAKTRWRLREGVPAAEPFAPPR